MKDTIILAIESSCDDTCAAVVKNGRKILSNIIISSAALQNQYGGVVPEVASRFHVDSIDKAVSEAMASAARKYEDLTAVAVTYGSGLLGSLLVGVSFAKSLAFAIQKPLLKISHIRSHISSCYLNSDIKPPFTALLASGGHTAVISVKNYTGYEIMGSTLDDAAGGGGAKVARCLGLAYPGGPEIEKAALLGKNTLVLPKMLKQKNGFDFSYSGLKTAVVNYINTTKMKNEKLNINDIACSFQTAALDILVEKLLLAAKTNHPAAVGGTPPLRGIEQGVIAACGGVAANSYLRDRLSQAAKEKNLRLYLPEKRLCTDNAAMVGAEAYLQFKYGNAIADLTLNAEASAGLL